jgi:hypothetical protein
VRNTSYKIDENYTSKTETVLIGVVIAIICPASLFVFLWWTAAALSLYHLLPVPENIIAIAAFAGLAIGIILDIFYLKKWMARFYAVNTKLLLAAYTFWSAVAVALFMGLPFGNIAWGMCAGLYVGRRQYHAGSPPRQFARAARNVSLFTAAVTSAEALTIGFLALREELVGQILRSATALGQPMTAFPVGIAFVITLSVILLAIQFWCTRTAARFAFRFGQHSA